MQLKIRAYLVWAKILAELEPQSVWIPLRLYMVFREQMGWPIAQDANELLEANPQPEEEPPVVDLPAALAATNRLARKRYHEYVPRRIGAVKNVRDKFGFLRGVDGKDYFFSRTNFRGRPHLGLKVTFRSRKGFDRKKKRKSAEAYDVEPLVLR